MKKKTTENAYQGTPFSIFKQFLTSFLSEKYLEFEDLCIVTKKMINIFEFFNRVCLKLLLQFVTNVVIQDLQGFHI
jgi:hypothetical protein